MKKRKLAAAALTMTLVGTMAVSAYAAGDMPLQGADGYNPVIAGQTDGEEASFQYDITINGQQAAGTACVMVPLRVVAEPLGFTVTWKDGAILVDNQVIHTQVTLGVDRYVITTSNEDLVGMSAPFSLGMAPFAVDGVAYVPLGLFDALLRDEGDSVRLEGDTVVIQTQQAELANPFVACASMAQAEQEAGFTIELPDRFPNWLDDMHFRAVPAQMLEVVYSGGGNELTVRKGIGGGDISGDYHTYSQVETVDSNGRQVKLKGEDGSVSVAVWEDGDYTYSVCVTPGMEKDDFLAVVGGIQ